MQPTVSTRLHKLQQAIKWTVYTLLIVNFSYYVYEDWTRAAHILDADFTLLDLFAEFATTIDTLAWFILLFMFELETYVLEDESWTGWVAHAVRGTRVACYVMLAHTVYAYLMAVLTLSPSVQVEGVTNLCQMADAEVSYVSNLEYTDVTADSCESLSNASEYYWIGEDAVVSDMSGLQLERDLALVDLAEALIWLLVLAALEIAVRLQGHGISGGWLLKSANYTATGLYATLIAIGFYWATLGHWLYFWDELLWIGGFAAIEMNLDEWRKEMLDESEAV